jgi:chemotaxis protein MotB
MRVVAVGVGRWPRYGHIRGSEENAIGMKPTLLSATLALALATAFGTVEAEDAPAPNSAPPSFEDVQATIKRMQERLDRLGSAAADRDQALRFLEQQVEQATGEIAGSGKTNESLLGETAALSDQLQDLSRARDQLQGAVGERQAALATLETQVSALSGELAQARDARTLLSHEVDTLRIDLAAATSREDDLKTKLAALEQGSGRDAVVLAERTADAERLRRQVAALEEAAATAARVAADRIASAEAAAASRSAEADRVRELLAALERKAGEDATAAAARTEDAERLRRQVAALEEAAATTSRAAAARIAAAEAEADRIREQLAALERKAGADATAAAARVATAESATAGSRQEAERLKHEVAYLNELLAAAETRVDEQQDQIDGLDEQLANALADKVEELEQYRSEFFGRLRVALGNRPDLRIVGDRFVFQSELLFASGSAQLDPAGQAQLRELARTLEDVAGRIPTGIDWVLRVDGHTDRQPIRDWSFRSNWELSAARAISVIEFLIAQGIPPEHLAAAGFGEYRPIDPADDEVAYRRNRRIEFKLTEG